MCELCDVADLLLDNGRNVSSRKIVNCSVSPSTRTLHHTGLSSSNCSCSHQAAYQPAHHP